jgi:DNA end-binding protein Ku
MRFADEVLAGDDIEAMPARAAKPDAKELKLATQIVDSLAGPWKPEQYQDTYTDEVKKLVRAHEKGEDIVVAEAPAARAEMADLMEALQSSLDAVRSKPGAGRAKAKKAAKSTRSPSARKSA